MAEDDIDRPSFNIVEEFARTRLRRENDFTDVFIAADRFQ